MKSRREFLKLVAAGSAAASTGRAGRAAAAAKHMAKKKAAPAHAAHAAKSAPVAKTDAIHDEIEKQKKNTADALKVIRDWPLPAGSPMAFTFQAYRGSRKGGR